jgi:hypothetical protein
MTPQPKGNWLRIALFLAGILAGIVGAGGVSAVQISNLESKYELDHDRLVRIETDVAWIKNFLMRLQREAKRDRMVSRGGAAGDHKILWGEGGKE